MTASLSLAVIIFFVKAMLINFSKLKRHRVYSIGICAAALSLPTGAENLGSPSKFACFTVSDAAGDAIAYVLPITHFSMQDGFMSKVSELHRTLRKPVIVTLETGKPTPSDSTFVSKEWRIPDEAASSIREALVKNVRLRDYGVDENHLDALPAEYVLRIAMDHCARKFVTSAAEIAENRIAEYANRNDLAVEYLETATEALKSMDEISATIKAEAILSSLNNCELVNSVGTTALRDLASGVRATTVQAAYRRELLSVGFTMPLSPAYEERDARIRSRLTRSLLEHRRGGRIIFIGGDHIPQWFDENSHPSGLKVQQACK